MHVKKDGMKFSIRPLDSSIFFPSIRAFLLRPVNKQEKELK